MSPMQGTAPDDTFVRTDGTRTGLNVWENAQLAGVDILSTAHDRHDQDIASALNYVYAQRGMQVVSQTTAAGASVFDFTLATGYCNVFVLDSMTLNTTLAIIVHINFLDASAVIIDGAGDYMVARHGYGGATAGAFGDHDTAVSALMPFTALGVNVAATANRTLSGTIEVYGAQGYATESYQRMQGQLTVREGGALTISNFVGDLAVERSVSKVRIQVQPGAFIAGHITHYRVRKS